MFDAVGDVPAGRPAEIVIGDSLIMIGSLTTSAMRSRRSCTSMLADADGTYQRAMDAGAVSLEAPLDTPYGDRRAMVRDPFGNVFQIATRSSSTAVELRASRRRLQLWCWPYLSDRTVDNRPPSTGEVTTTVRLRSARVREQAAKIEVNVQPALSPSAPAVVATFVLVAEVVLAQPLQAVM